jgi:WD repeat and SOF domain-containing protein 1
MWDLNARDSSMSNYKSDGSSENRIHTAEPVNVFLGRNNFSGIDHHKRKTMFATSGVQVDLWDHNRSEPVHSFQWGADSVMSVKFNPIDTDVLLSSASDRNMVLYDTRTKTPIRKVIMQHLTNAIAWNPMESYNFVAANEDTNLYTFDMRNLDKAVTVHKDHVSAVLHVDFSPTGKDFVSGSYDRTLRLWGAEDATSRDVYHTKRMQRIFCVQYSQDNRYVMSGSDDTNIRMWKAKSTERLQTLLPRQIAAQNYQEKLKERYQHAPEVRAIKNQKLVPTAIKKATRLRKVQNASKQRKIKNVIRHTGVAPEEAKNIREAKIVKVIK